MNTGEEIKLLNKYKYWLAWLLINRPDQSTIEEIALINISSSEKVFLGYTIGVWSTYILENKKK